MRERNDMRCYGQSFKSPINVSNQRITKHTHVNIDIGTGSRYIYDLYYEKEAISKKLYDWLLKNGYADANLIAKWKKQGYEKVSCLPNSSYKVYIGLIYKPCNVY